MYLNSALQEVYTVEIVIYLFIQLVNVQCTVKLDLVSIRMCDPLGMPGEVSLDLPME